MAFPSRNYLPTRLPDFLRCVPECCLCNYQPPRRRRRVSWPHRRHRQNSGNTILNCHRCSDPQFLITANSGDTILNCHRCSDPQFLMASLSRIGITVTVHQSYDRRKALNSSLREFTRTGPLGVMRMRGQAIACPRFRADGS